jgi:outer membrane protein TolC
MLSSFKFKFVFICLFFNILSPAFGQVLNNLSLKESIAKAQHSSLSYKIAFNIAQSNRWNYQIFKAGLLPKLNISGEIPNYYRNISKITLPSGENDFVVENFIGGSASLNLRQNIPLTGGSFTVSSSLQRIDNLGTFSSKAYTSVPLSLSYFQNNLFINELKWNGKLEKLKLTETERKYAEDLEDIAFNAVLRFFDVISAESKLKLDSQNLKNIDTLLKTSEARYAIGTKTLNDILQIRISYGNAKTSLNSSLLRLHTSKQELIRFLNLEKDRDIGLVTPDFPKFVFIDLKEALLQAAKNRKFGIEFKRRKLEAELAVKRTAAATAPAVSIRANIGLTQTNADFVASYSSLLRNQYLTIGFSVPIIDWGSNKANRKKALSMQELEIANIEQENVFYEQEIESEIINWNMLQQQASISKETVNLAQRRYEIAKQKYLLGTLTFTDFNNSQLEKDKASGDYLDIIKSFWMAHYKIRRITLYDFEKKNEINFKNLID